MKHVSTPSALAAAIALLLSPTASAQDATTLDAVITEIAASRLTERGATRADDKMSEAAMEDRKREGYF